MLVDLDTFWIILLFYCFDFSLSNVTGISLVLAGVMCLLCNFSQFSRCAKPVTQRQNFPWSNPTPSPITANQNSLSLSRVLKLSVTDQSALGHSRCILAIESSKHFGRPTTILSFPTSLYILICVIFEDIAIFHLIIVVDVIDPDLV